MISKMFRLILACCLLVVCFIAAPAPVKKEFKVKAGLIYNFVNFTRWPSKSFENKSSDYVICIAGDDPYSAIFAMVSEQTVHGRHLKTMKLDSNADMLSLAQCHILFVRLTDQDDREALLNKSQAFPVLTISETDDGQPPGSMINFINNNNSIAFTVNRATAKQVGIGFSSKMLRLALQVTGGKK